jgi:hypothetical protein
MLFPIWHGGSTLSGERGGYIRILIRRWGDMVPCVLRPDVGGLGKKSGVTSKIRKCKDDLHGERGTFLEPKGGLDASMGWTDDVRFGIILCG